MGGVETKINEEKMKGREGEEKGKKREEVLHGGRKGEDERR